MSSAACISVGRLSKSRRGSRGLPHTALYLLAHRAIGTTAAEVTNFGPGFLGKAPGVGHHVSLAAEAHSIVSMDDKSEKSAAEIAPPR